MTAGAGELHPAFRVVEHPLIRHKVSLLRDVETDRKLFRELVDEISMLMAYEVTADLATRTRAVKTPLEATEGEFVEGEELVLVPILRAGLGMVDGVLRLIPTMGVGHIGLQREHETLEPVDYYFKIPPDPESREFIVTDPMLATGGSASAAIQYLKDSGAVDVRIMVLVASPEGVRRLAKDHPDVPVFAGPLPLARPTASSPAFPLSGGASARARSPVVASTASSVAEGDPPPAPPPMAERPRHG